MFRRSRPGRRPARRHRTVPTSSRHRTPRFELLEDRRLLAAESEPNNSIATADVLGSEPFVTVQDAVITFLGDQDFYRYTAHDTGKLIARSLFDHVAGDLRMEIQDANGNVIAMSDFSAVGVNQEQIIIPVVAQQSYFILVENVGVLGNTYDLEVENFAAPVPTGIHLDPASDTGTSNNDNVTSDTTPTFFIQTDVLEFVDANGSGTADVGEIRALTAVEAAAGVTSGIAVEVTLVNTTTGSSTTGFADPLIASVPEVYRFTTSALTPGIYLVSSRTKVFDGRQNPPGTPSPAMGRSAASPPLWMTIDTTPAAPGTVSIDLLNSSDNGMYNNDNVTSKMQPAFQGIAPANSKVRLFANGETVGQTVTGSDTSDVGHPVGGIGGANNDGLGLWEITTEPLADNAYDITLEIEDAAGNVFTFDPILNPGFVPLPDVVIDTVSPNTPYLDLLDDTGRNSSDNITKDNTPQVSMTSTDPNVALARMIFEDNLKFRIYDRFESTAEFLLYDSAFDAIVDASNIPGDMFTSLMQVFAFLPEQYFVLHGVNPAVLNMGGIGVLADGIHNLKLEVEDRAGNISEDFLLTITIDTTAPPVSFGLPDAANDADGLTASSDTGVTTMPATYADRITSDTTPTLWGRAEADSIVRVFLDRNGDGAIDLLADTFLGQTVALPYNGNDAYPNGYWEITSALDLNQIVGLPKDGLRTLLVTAEDVAGNPMPMDDFIAQGVESLQIFIDTQGPQVTGVTVNNLTTSQYDLFDPKPSVTGYTLLVTSLKIAIRDLPRRIDQAGTANDFLYEALLADIAGAAGNYLLVGDHVGAIAIQSISVTNDPRTNNNPAMATVELLFSNPLPDDRYTLTISDNLVDPAGNKLDGESNANQPTDVPTFPSGDGVPGGKFVARFTIDSRPEIGSYVSQNINIDINGNFVWDPANSQIGGDATNVDISWTLPVQNADGTIGLGGFNVHDLLFAGKFFQPNGVATRHFDQLAAFGNSAELGNVFRWIIDTNSDGVVTLGTDIRTIQPLLGNFNVSGAIPVTGNFDGNPNNGDEIGLYNSGKWGLDFNHNFVIEAGEVISTGLFGRPIVGDFDGDGKDDLAVFNNNVFYFNLANDGFGDANDRSLVWGFPGVLDQSVAADMDQDGIDDIGLWVPRTSATPPAPLSQWYFLVSNDPTGALRTTGNINRLNHAFTPTPFGSDLYAEFGDDRSMPIVGNFDPPVVPRTNTSTLLAGDYSGDGRVDQADYTVWKSNFGSTSNLAADGNGNGIVDSSDYTIWRNNLGAVGAAAAQTVVVAGGEGSGQLSVSSTESSEIYYAIEPGSPNVAEPANSALGPATDSPADDLSLLLVLAQEPSTSVDEALEEFGSASIADSDEPESSSELDAGALAVAWHSWDEL